MLMVVGGVVLPPRPDEKPYKKFLHQRLSRFVSPIVLVIELVFEVVAPYSEKHVGGEEGIGTGLVLRTYPLQLRSARPD